MNRIRRNQTSYKKRAFTLIELLVVISIIAVLAALIFPAINSIKTKAGESKCSHRLKQWAVAIASFENDHNGMVLCGSAWNTVGAGTLGVDTKFYEIYLNPKGEKSYTWPGRTTAIHATQYYRACPAQDWSGSSSPTGYGFVRPRELNASGTSYIGIKTTLDGSDNTLMLAYNIRRVSRPSQLLQLMETAGSPNQAKSLTNYPELDSFVKPICTNPEYKRHGPKVNGLFADGHVESFTWEQIDPARPENTEKVKSWFYLE